MHVNNFSASAVQDDLSYLIPEHLGAVLSMSHSLYARTQSLAAVALAMALATRLTLQRRPLPVP